MKSYEISIKIGKKKHTYSYICMYLRTEYRLTDPNKITAKLFENYLSELKSKESEETINNSVAQIGHWKVIIFIIATLTRRSLFISHWIEGGC